MSNKPSNAGKAWNDDEVVQLLKEIQKKVSIDQIAVIHGRTSGGIWSRLREIAADYHFNDERSVEEIMKFTGLSEDDIKDAILRRVRRDDLKEERQKQKEQKQMFKTIPKFIENEIKPNKENNSDILTVLIDIKNLLIENNKKLDVLTQARH
jgi:hypothetical protein